ncbi:MAG: hypothetical protein KGL35_20905, partial [Bradyrhizobium sp.]|nr:hypothetical protein [Bradyrhizobium sp.]
ERGGLGESMRWFYKHFPAEPYYGWLADDLRPRTKGWDIDLARDATPNNFVCCNDDWMAHNPQTRFLIQSGKDMCGALCWGGDLVRAVGWWMPPFIKHDQVSADTCWCVILAPTGRFRYRHDIIVEHLNWRTRKRERDAVDALSARHDATTQEDLQAVGAWITGGDAAQAIMRIYELGR